MASTFGEDDGRDISKLIRQRMPLREAIVESVSGLVYTLKDCATGGQLTATAAQGVTWAVGKRVTVFKESSGGATGRGWQIVGASQAESNGAVVGILEYSVPRSAATITLLPTLPIRLVKGGLAEVVAI